jgi:hypothetical protein
MWIPAIAVAFGGRPKIGVTKLDYNKTWYMSFIYIHIMVSFDDQYEDYITGAR